MVESTPACSPTRGYNVTAHSDVLSQAAAVARRHGVAPDDVEEVAGGVANQAFVLGECLFLRIARPGYESNLSREVHVVPAARSVGVRTPPVVDYDTTDALIGAPYIVTERIHGTEPTDIPADLAEQLALLHQLQLKPSAASDYTAADLAALGAPPVDDWGDPWRTIDDLADRGYVDLATADWLTAWFHRLADRFDRGRPKVLIHGDVAAHNLLVNSDGELEALIDWGDTAWAPRAMDFAKLPLTQVARLLPDYIRHAKSPEIPLGSAGESETELAAATLWFHLSWALARLPAPPWPDQRHWTAPTASRLLNIVHFFTTNPPPPWSTLT
ncbi:aminoglycoside phosphotransferase family protein [Kribbella sp. NPDC048915]|uniref:phosphotransferase family protein n=1 Tax=Kribbella sp. NPDC048915 TaxID=3155148 RepID=UPI00340A70E6